MIGSLHNIIERPTALGHTAPSRWSSSPAAAMATTTKSHLGAAKAGLTAYPHGRQSAQWAATLAAKALEVSLGLRPVSQARRWFTADIYARLADKYSVASRIRGWDGPHHVTVRNVRAHTTPRGAAEASVILDDGQRIRAIAIRLESLNGHWVATQLHIG